MAAAQRLQDIWNEKANVAQKCTMCAHLLDDGWQTPRCVQVCPTGALTFVDTEDETQASRILDKALTPLFPEHNTRPRVKYKNLYRFDKCFITGSVAFENNENMECATGARVVLKQGEEVLEETFTDAFGDFKFDKLAPKSRRYSVVVTFDSLPERILEVDLEESISLGTILLT